MYLDTLLALAAIALALAMRPWRAVPAGGLPWPALACWAALPLLWNADHATRIAVLQPLSGSCLLMLMLGWPLATLMTLPVAAVLYLGGMDAAQTLHRCVWLGIAPATLAVAMGAALRRWLPHHLMIYILGRGFFITAIAGTLAGAASAALQGVPVGTSLDDMLLARGFAAWGDAFITGMLVAIFVAFRPGWLATYTDKLYLPR